MKRRLATQLLIALGAIGLAASAAGSEKMNGPIFYRQDWEKGLLDTSHWGAQCDNLPLAPAYVGTRGSFKVQRETVGQGRWAARFDLPSHATKATACEVIHNRTLDLGRDDYYALSVLFPHGWREPGDQPSSFWGMVIAQFNYQLITGPPVGLFAHRRYVNLVIGSGYFDGYATRWYTGNGIARGNLPRLYAIPRPLKLGSWHELILRVRWSADNGGAVDVWHRLRSKRRWKQTVRFRGKPTVQWTSSKPAVSEMRTWDKLGGYRGVSSHPASVWHDGYCRAATFQAAQSCLS